VKNEDISFTYFPPIERNLRNFFWSHLDLDSGLVAFLF
jgi:hypothetical protein